MRLFSSLSLMDAPATVPHELALSEKPQGLQAVFSDPVVSTLLQTKHIRVAVLSVAEGENGKQELRVLCMSQAFRDMSESQVDGIDTLRALYTSDTMASIKDSLAQHRGWISSIVGFHNASKRLVCVSELKLWPLHGYGILIERPVRYSNPDLLTPASPTPTKVSGAESTEADEQDIVLFLSTNGIVLSASEGFLSHVKQHLSVVRNSLMSDWLHLEDSDEFQKMLEIFASPESEGKISKHRFRLGLTENESEIIQFKVIGMPGQLLLVGSPEKDSATRVQVEMESRLKEILDSVEDGFISTDQRWKVSYLNRRAFDLLGISNNNVFGSVLWDILPALRSTSAYRTAMRASSEKKQFDFEFEMASRLISGKAIPSKDGVSLFFTDITEIKAKEKEIYRQAMHDSLTGLPNRQAFLQELERRIHSAFDNDNLCSVLFLDLDGFKAVNDTKGHPAGDELLRQVAKRIKEIIRPSDFLARLGGDEFVVIVDKTESEDPAFVVGNKIITALSSSPFKVFNDSHYIGVSIGVATYPHHADEISALLKNADIAMYAAKKAGRGCVKGYTPGLSEEVNRTSQIEVFLKNALARDSLSLHYQPRFNLQRKLVGFEALMRIDSGSQTPVPPSEFIEVAEKTGLIHRMGQQVLVKAVSFLETIYPQYLGKLRISINVSAVQVESNEFWDSLEHIIEQTPYGQMLELELTESSMLPMTSAVIEKLRALHKRGVKFSIDDFGTGYSSLAVLHQMPLDILKIDRSFIAKMCEDNQSLQIVKAIVALAQALNLQCVAEGVETEAQFATLSSLGVTEFQGFLLGRPMPEDKALHLIERA